MTPSFCLGPELPSMDRRVPMVSLPWAPSSPACLRNPLRPLTKVRKGCRVAATNQKGDFKSAPGDSPQAVDGVQTTFASSFHTSCIICIYPKVSLWQQNWCNEWKLWMLDKSLNRQWILYCQEPHFISWSDQCKQWLPQDTISVLI